VSTRYSRTDALADAKFDCGYGRSGQGGARHFADPRLSVHSGGCSRLDAGLPTGRYSPTRRDRPRSRGRTRQDQITRITPLRGSDRITLCQRDGFNRSWVSKLLCRSSWNRDHLRGSEPAPWNLSTQDVGHEGPIRATQRRGGSFRNDSKAPNPRYGHPDRYGRCRVLGLRACQSGGSASCISLCESMATTWRP
jgi:hypothetical protein